MSELAVPQRRFSFRRLLSSGLLAGIVVGASVGLLLVGWFPEILLTDFQKRLITIPVVILLALLAIALHEVGHLVGGWLVGFRAHLLLVGPLKVERTGEGGIRIGLNKNLLLGALAETYPTDTHNLRLRMLLMVASGPGAGLIGGVVALALWASIRPSAEASFLEAGAAFGVWGFSVLSLAISLSSLVPMPVGGFLTDGARILRLLHNNRDTDREVAFLALTGLSMGGMRPREWPQALVDQMLTNGEPDPSPGPLAKMLAFPAVDLESRMLAFSRAIDLDRIDEARAHLNAALAGRDLLPEAGRVSLDLRTAWLIAVHDGDARRAREIFQKVGDQGPLSPVHERHLTEGAILWREGDTAGAREKLEEARRRLPQSNDPGAARADADRIEELLRAL